MNQTDPSDNHHPLSSRETGQHRDSLASNVSPLNELVPGKHSAILGATKGILTHSKKSTSFHKSHMSNKSDLLGHEKAKDTNKADKYANIGGNKVVPLSRKPVVTVGSRMEIAEVESPSPHRRNSELREQKTILAAPPAQVSRLWTKVKANRKRLLMMEQMATQLDHLQFEGSTVSRKPVTECSISHEGTVHKWLQVVRSVTLLFMMFAIPIQFAFKDSTDGINSAGFKAGLGMVDMLYLVRTVLDAFFITYQAPSGYVVTDDVLIFQRFRKYSKS